MLPGVAIGTPATPGCIPRLPGCGSVGDTLLSCSSVLSGRPSLQRRDQSVTQGQMCELHVAARTQLAHDSRAIGADGLGADAELGGDLATLISPTQ